MAAGNAPGTVIQSLLIVDELVGCVLKEEMLGVLILVGLRQVLIICCLFFMEVPIRGGAAVPLCHTERKSSQPLLRVAPGPWGWARVAESTWPACFFLHSALV